MPYDEFVKKSEIANYYNIVAFVVGDLISNMRE